MSQLIIDETLRIKLIGLKQPVDFLDESGELLGRYTPACSAVRHEPQFDEAELLRREREDDFSTQEVLDYLRKL